MVFLDRLACVRFSYLFDLCLKPRFIVTPFLLFEIRGPNKRLTPEASCFGFVP